MTATAVGTDDEKTETRLYIGYAPRINRASSQPSRWDLHDKIQHEIGESDIQKLLAPFVVRISNIDNHANKHCAHVSVVTIGLAPITRLIKAYNNSHWRGNSTLRIELARPSFQTRLATERAVILHGIKSAPQIYSAVSKVNTRRLKRLLRSQPVSLHPSIDKPVSDKPTDWTDRKLKGWKLSKKLSRPVLVVKTKVKKANGKEKIINIDPSKFYNKITRLYPLRGIPEPSVTQLDWPGIKDNENFIYRRKNKTFISVANSDTDTDLNENTSRRESFNQLTPSNNDIPILPNKISKRELMAKKWHSSFSSDEEEEYNKVEKSQQLVNCNDSNDVIPEVAEDLTEEREVSMAILRDLLGMAVPTPESRAIHAPVFWRKSQRFDPDAPDSNDLLREVAKYNESGGKDEDDGKNVEYDEMDFENSTSVDDEKALGDDFNASIENNDDGIVIAETNSQSAPISSYTVNTNLRSLVFGTDEDDSRDGLFSWFGKKNTDESDTGVEPSGPGMLGDAIREKVGGVIKSTERFSLLGALGLKHDDSAVVPEDVGERFVQKVEDKVKISGTTSFIGSSKLFFFHFDDPTLMKR
ncbi:hypothetical protein HK100_001729, partial [Physocladia obscura]